MASSAGQTIALVAFGGVGIYLFIEYQSYQSGIATINKADPSGNSAAQVQAAMPFMTWVMLNIGFSQPSTAQEAAAFNAMQNAIGGTIALPPAPTPGTTPTMTQASAPTTVSTTPTSTPTTQGSAGGTSASTPSVTQPTAADLQHAANMTLATADQWNYFYIQLMGAPMDKVLNFNFDTVYGPIVNGVRSSGQMSAQAFLNAPVSLGFAAGTTHTALSPRPGFHAGALAGLGAIAHFYTPVVRSSGSMIYAAQHPSPYRQPQTNMSGFTQPTGMEMALLGRQSLRSNKLI